MTGGAVAVAPGAPNSASMETGMLDNMPGAKPMADDADDAEIDACVEALVEALVERQPPPVAWRDFVLFCLGGFRHSELDMLISGSCMYSGACWNVNTKHKLWK